MSTQPGLFLTVEGIEGAGKTTHARLLVRALEAYGRPSCLTHEPGGGGPVGEALRALLKDPAHWREMQLAEVFLYAAARVQHLESVVLPALAAGQVVVCDRYLDSTRAYQGYGRGRPLETIESLHAIPPLDRRPDRTILLDVDPAVGLGRARRRAATDKPGYDDENLAFFHRVRDGFRAVARQHPERVRVVQAAENIAAVHRDIIAAVEDLFPGLTPLEDAR